MKHLILLSCLLVAPCVGQNTPAGDADLPDHRVYGEPASAEDAEAVSELMGRFGEAWGRGDAAAVAAAYAEDAEWTNAFGTVLRGPAEVRDFLTRMFSEDDAGASAGELSSYRRLSLRFVGADVAIIHGVVISMRGVSENYEAARRVHNTYVLAKQNGDWRIVHHMIMDARE